MVERRSGIHVLLEELGENDFFDDAFSAEGISWAARHLEEISRQIEKVTFADFAPVLPEENQAQFMNHVREATFKAAMLAVMPAAIDIHNEGLLTHFGRVVNGMYVPNDFTDRGGVIADKLMEAVDFMQQEHGSQPTDLTVRGLWKAITRTEEHIAQMTTPEDQPPLVDRVQRQVVRNEVTVQRMSRQYLRATQEGVGQRYIEEEGRQFTALSVESAGVPAITAGQYVLYRKLGVAVPPLTEVYSDPNIVRLDLVFNAIARLWDDMGDRLKDGSSETFVVNCFNQRDPNLINPYLDLAGLQGERRRVAYEAILDFPGDQELHTQLLTREFIDHLNETIYTLPPATQRNYEHYITLSKRVAKIAWINIKGDKKIEDIRGGNIE